jgi:hypothetical protein
MSLIPIRHRADVGADQGVAASNARPARNHGVREKQDCRPLPRPY